MYVHLTRIIIFIYLFDKPRLIVSQFYIKQYAIVIIQVAIPTTFISRREFFVIDLYLPRSCFYINNSKCESVLYTDKSQTFRFNGKHYSI